MCPYAWDRPGGVQSHVGGLAGALRSRGHEVAVVAPAASGGRPPDGIVVAGRAVGVPANGSIAPIAFGPRAAAAVRRALDDLEPDVVHLHEPLVPSLSLLALTGRPRPCVGTFHAAAQRSTGYAAARPLLGRAAARLNARTAVSDAARALAARYFPGDYALTPNGIDPARFASVRPAGFGSRPTVLFLGRIERRKGLVVLMQAMARVRDLDAVLVVAGTGPGEGRYRRLAQSLAIRTQWLGRVPEDDIPGVYAGASVYCAPALGGESFGIVLLEAMAAGAPVVCSDLAAFRAVAGPAAAFAPPGDAGELAFALRTVLADPSRRAEMARHGRRIAASFSWDRLVPGVEAVYRRAAG